VGVGRYLEVRTIGDVGQHLAAIRASAARAQSCYVFFMSPRHPGAQRQPALERDGVQVWSVDV
jgi:hypothetical protein